MLEAYDELISRASEEFAKAIWATEGNLVERTMTIDGDVRELLRQVGKKVVELLYGRLVEKVMAEAPPGLKVQRRKKVTFSVLFGEVEVESPYLWSAEGGSARPVKDQLGITARGRSQTLQRALTDFGAEKSFGRAVRQFEEHYGWEVGRTTMLRVVEGEAERIEGYVRERLDAVAQEYDAPLAVRPGVPELLAELDGCEIRTGELVPIEEGEEGFEEEANKCRRKEAWRDVRVGLVRGVEELEPTFVAAMADYTDIIGKLFQAAVGHGLSENTLVLAPGDGGIGLMEEMRSQFPQLQYILDRPHLKSHLHDTARALHTDDKMAESWVEAKMALIDDGQVSTALEHMRREYADCQNDRLRQLIKHVDRFKECVSYKKYLANGWPIGSGEIESAHRYIPQERLKLPGAWWHPDNVNPMLALRVLRANGWWEDYWAQRSASAGTARAAA